MGWWSCQRTVALDFSAKMIYQLSKHNQPKVANTMKSTNVWVRAYNSWRLKRGFEKALESTDPVCLNKDLQSLYAKLIKQNGKDCEPSCLTVMLAALDRHLKNLLAHSRYKTNPSTPHEKFWMARQNRREIRERESFFLRQILSTQLKMTFCGVKDTSERILPAGAHLESGHGKGYESWRRAF